MVFMIPKRAPRHRLVGVGKHGLAGVDHHKAKLTWELAEAMRDMREEHGMTQNALREWLLDWHGIAVSRWCIRRVLNFEVWRTFPERWKKVPLEIDSKNG